MIYNIKRIVKKITIKQSDFTVMYRQHYPPGTGEMKWSTPYLETEDFGLRYIRYDIEGNGWDTYYIYEVIDEKKFLLCSIKYNLPYRLV